MSLVRPCDDFCLGLGSPHCAVSFGVPCSCCLFVYVDLELFEK